MKFYNSVGPNPQVVRVFAAELGMKLNCEEVDLMAGENRQAPYLAKNPAGQLPCLELDNGEYLSEVTAICEYLDELNNGNSLLGSTPEERAETRMWTRRIDLNICEPMGNGFRFGEGLPLFQERITTLPEASEGMKRIATEKIAWLNEQMNGREFVCGDRISLADVLLFCFLAFGKSIGQPYDEANQNIHAWFERMSQRDSAAA
jgi:glutathione S-transferase